MIFNLQALGMYGTLAEFIGKFEAFSGTKNSIYKEIPSVVLVTSKNDPKELVYRINLYGLSKNYFDAVSMAIDNLEKVEEPRKKEFEELAYRWASKHEKLEIRKKLWLKIAMIYRKDEAKIKQMLALKLCPLKITDVLGLLDENDDISS